MPEKPRPPIKNCPMCGVAMLADRSEDGLIDYDTFTCLNCRMVVSYGRGRRDPGRKEG